MRVFIALILLSALSACEDPFTPPPEQAIGMRPVYDHLMVGTIVSEEPRMIDELAGLVSFGSLLLLTESGSGIHVIDNTDPAAPVFISFLNLPTISGFVIQDGFIYASLTQRLVTITLTEDGAASIVDILDDGVQAVAGIGLRPPDSYDGVFECVDDTRGLVIAWVEDVLQMPNCRQ